MSLNTPIFLKEREEDNSKFVEIQQSQTTSIAAEYPLQNLCLASQEVLQKAQQNGRSITLFILSSLLKPSAANINRMPYILNITHL